MYNYTELITKRISELIEGRAKDKEIVLYPFGERGKLAKAILNTYFGVEELMVVDNNLSKMYESIKGLDSLVNIDFDDKLVLITSDNPVIHKELCDKLYQIVPRHCCVELFPDIIKEQESESNQNNIRLIELIQEKSLVEDKMIYNSRKTNSKFFLPYIFTDYIQQTIFETDDYYDRQNLDKVFKFDDGVIKEGMSQDACFIDVGANIGNHTLYFVNELKINNVYAFEPVEETYWILEKNIKINELEEKVELYKVGVSDHEANATTAWYHMDNTGGTALAESENGSIQLMTLDSLNLDDVYFIKIDVEGMEKRVLLGAMKTIRKYHPYIMIESFPTSFPDVKTILEDEGYRYEVLSEGSDYLFMYDKR